MEGRKKEETENAFTEEGRGDTQFGTAAAVGKESQKKEVDAVGEVRNEVCSVHHCNECPKKFKWRHRLDKHIAVVHAQKTFNVLTAPRFFQEKTPLNFTS